MCMRAFVHDACQSVHACMCVSSSSAFPATSLGFTILNEIFACEIFIFFLNSTIEAVAFCPCGWCVLGVFSCQHSTAWDSNVRIY